MIKKSAIFLDRDGVINKKMPEGDYVKAWEEFYFLPGAFEALRILKQNNFLNIIITNQRCIAKRIITEDKLKKIHQNMLREITRYGGGIDAIYFCPHEIFENCDCRKPKPGMIIKAINDFKNRGIDINLKNSYMIGDSKTDILTGKAVGLNTIKVSEYLDLKKCLNLLKNLSI